MIDFTDCRIDLYSEYTGSDQKKGVIYNGKRYMLKMADKIKDENRNSLNSSYSNSVFSEKVCCDILKELGYEVQNTLIGYLRREGKENQPVVACENFVRDGWLLISFKTIQSALQENKPGKIPKIEEIYNIYSIDNEYFTKEFGKKEIGRYWDCFILDAFLGNFDRHANNWSYLINKETQEIKRAPIYDCGSCLYPQISDDGMRKILNSPEEINMRIDKFPQACLLDYDGNKINYRDYISSMKNVDCTKALVRVYKRINIDKVLDVIENQKDISEIRKEFYKTMLKERYRRILEYSYEKYLDYEKGKNKPQKIF